jgi:hypothetical protein
LGEQINEPEGDLDFAPWAGATHLSPRLRSAAFLVVIPCGSGRLRVLTLIAVMEWRNHYNSFRYGWR